MRAWAPPCELPKYYLVRAGSVSSRRLLKLSECGVDNIRASARAEFSFDIRAANRPRKWPVRQLLKMSVNKERQKLESSVNCFCGSRRGRVFDFDPGFRVAQTVILLRG
jgi:hypothetical protein